MNLNPSSGSSPRAESDSFLSTSPLADSRLKGIMLSILTSHSDSVHSISFPVSILSRTSHNLAAGEQWCEWIKNSGICWLDHIHSSPVLRTNWSETQVYILFFSFRCQHGKVQLLRDDIYLLSLAECAPSARRVSPSAWWMSPRPLSPGDWVLRARRG